MDQRNETFVPHVLAVMVGTVVDFPNSDKTFHNVFSLSQAKRFDLGRYAAGRSKSVRFDRPGVVRVFCDIHSHMNAFVLVFSHPFFDVTDADGRFRIDNVPAGTYTVVGWYEGERAHVARRVDRCRAGGSASISSSSVPVMARALVADQPHLPREHAAGHRVDRLRRVLRQQPAAHARPKPSCSAICAKRPAWSSSSARRCSTPSRAPRA